MIAFWTLRIDALRRRGRRVLRWAKRHPRSAVILGLAIAWLLTELAGDAAAFADSDGPSTLPNLPSSGITDSDGVSLVHYNTLPLDRGDAWTFKKTFWTSIVDLIWTGHLTSIGWMLWLFKWLLGFEWVQWLATPISFIGQYTHNLLSQIGWVPLALAVTAVVCGIAFMTGKIAQSLVEVGISVLCAVLAVTVATNPVGTLTGPHGVLTTVENYGGTIAAGIAAGEDSPRNVAPSAAQAQKVLSTTITQQLVDVFVRLPAQEIAFGHDLTGNCETVFTTQMKATNPVDSGSTAVRDAVKGCDQAAWDYVTNPGPSQVFTAGWIMLGAEALFILAVAMALVLLMSVGYGIVKSVKLGIAVYVAVLPGVGRQSLWSSFIGMYVGAGGVGLSVVLLAAYLRLLTDTMDTLAHKGLTIVMQTSIVNLFVIACVVSLFWAWRSAKKAGETLAQRISRMGFGGASAPRRANPVLASAKRVGETYLGNRIYRSSVSAPAPQLSGGRTVNMLNVFGGGRGGAGSVKGPNYEQMPAPGGTPGAGTPGAGATGGKLGAVAGRAAITAATVGAGVASGGTSSVVMAMGKVAGKRVMQRAVVSGSQQAAKALTGGGSASAAPPAVSSPRALSSASMPVTAPADRPAAGALTGGAVGGQKELPAAPGTSETPAVSRGGRRLTPAGSPTSQAPAIEPSSRSYVGFGRQIVVASDGTGTIAPREAPQRSGAYNITSLRPQARPNSADSELRRRLQQITAAGVDSAPGVKASLS